MNCTTPEGLKAARATLGLTQKTLAAALGVHVITISKMEVGMVRIPPVIALAVECLLRRSPSSACYAVMANPDASADHFVSR